MLPFTSGNVPENFNNLLYEEKTMKKAIVSVVVALTFAVSSVAVAATVKCTVDSVEGDKVCMTCKNADSLSAGDEVKVKAKKKGGAAIEGC